MQRNLASWLSIATDLRGACEDLMDHICVGLNEIDCGTLHMCRPDGALSIVAQRNHSAEFIKAYSTIPATSSLTEFINQGNGVFINKNELNRLPIAEYFGDASKSAAILPLRYGGEIKAVLIVVSRTVDAISLDIREALKAVVSLASAAMARLLAQKALKDNEKSLIKAQRIAQVGSWELNLAEDTVRLSQQTCRILGIPQTEQYQRRIDLLYRVIHPEDLKTERFLTYQLGDRVEKPMIFRIIRPNGEERWVVASPPELGEPGKDGMPTIVVGTIQDITERKRTEEELMRLKSAVEQSIDGISIADLEGNLLFVNQAWADMHNYKTEELVGKNLSIFHSEKESSEVLVPFNKRVKEEGSNQGEVVHLAKGGHDFLAWRTCTLIKDRFGNPIGYVTVARDITEQKRAEIVMEKAKENAEKLSRDLASATEAANKAASEAAEANRAKSFFLANMSHEIRSPMNGVVGMIALLLDTELTDEQREFAETVKKSSEALLSVINDILDFSKIEAGKMDLEQIDFDLMYLLDEANDLLAVRAHGKGLEYTCIVDQNVPLLLKGDPTRIRQILINLVGNAIKFTNRGEVSVEVDLLEETDNVVVIRFAIIDTGIGIPEEKKESLFEAFTQSDVSTTRRFGGTGLGLTISKQLARLLGGDIHIESEEGKGSTFWFTVRSQRQSVDEARLWKPTFELTSIRVLIVDDNATNRRLLSAHLHSWGCRYEEAENAESAFAKLVEASYSDPFKVTLIDMQMPGMDGEQLGRKIQRDPRISTTSLIMMNALGQRGDIQRFKEAGFTAYLTKPVKQAQLLNCLTSSVRHSIRPMALYATKKDKIYSLPTVKDNKRKARILLAEDNAVNQKVALRLLMKFGYEADAVENGEQAVEALRTIDYDLVLMDCQMPVMDGYQATRVVRDPESRVHNHGVPIIAMTANAMKGDREKCLEVGMDDYLAKPVNPFMLSQILQRWIPVSKRDSLEQDRA